MMPFRMKERGIPSLLKIALGNPKTQTSLLISNSVPKDPGSRQEDRYGKIRIHGSPDFPDQALVKTFNSRSIVEIKPGLL